jgi:rSAM/selenodomain-associated transferase 1
LKNLLIIFYRNPELGKVKTRLAKTLGDEKALAIYLRLAAHTRLITEEIPIDKAVYYSHFVDTEDGWANSAYAKKIQRGTDLGEKMLHAFEDGFKNGYSSICIIGTDCLELQQSIISNAFEQLHIYDTVLGPAKDGGYYLLGMKKLLKEAFQNKEWSTDTVASSTLKDFIQKQLNYYVLPPLTDIDEEKDLPEHWHPH